MQQLLLFGAPPALNSPAGAENGLSTSSNGAFEKALLGDSAGFAEAMRSVLSAQSGSIHSAGAEAAGADVSVPMDLAGLSVNALTWQQSAASDSMEGQLLPLSPAALQLPQATDLSESTSAIQALLHNEGTGLDLGIDTGAPSVGALVTPAAETNVMSALALADSASVEVPPSSISSNSNPEALQIPVASELRSSATEINQPLPSAAVTKPDQIQTSVLASSQAATEGAAVSAGSSHVFSNAISRTAIRAGNSVAGGPVSANGVSAASGGLAAESSLKTGVIDTVSLVSQPLSSEAQASESQRQLASQWNSYLQSGSLTQPSAQSDVNFKLSMEQALSGVDADSGGDVPDELLAKLSEPAAPKAQELSQRVTSSADKSYSSSVNVPVGDPEWGAKMNEKVVWLSGRGIQSAQIHLNPVELGPVDVKVSVQNDQTVISFNVQNAGVKELLESNVQRLREMIDQNGNADIEVNVEERSSSREGLAQNQQNAQHDGHGGSGDNAQNGAAEDEVSVSSVSDVDQVSLVDYYA